jgi:transposase-like protein
VATALEAIRRYVARDSANSAGSREVKRALVKVAINAGYTDAKISRDLGVSRDLARDVRRAVRELDERNSSPCARPKQ